VDALFGPHPVGEDIAVGAPGQNYGDAYLFETGTYSQLFHLAAPVVVGEGRAGFGTAVALTETTVLVGEPHRNVGSFGVRHGACHEFDLATGQLVSRLDPADGYQKNYGLALAASPRHVAAGGAGSSEVIGIYDYRPRIGQTYCWTWPNSTGEIAEIVATGSDLAADGSIVVVAMNLPKEQFGYFLNSPAQGFVAFPGGSQGNLCLEGGIGRHTAQIGSTDSALPVRSLPGGISAACWRQSLHVQDNLVPAGSQLHRAHGLPPLLIPSLQ